MKEIKILNFAPKRGGKCPKDKRGAEKAFTLAEILITLSIIGVVAALTIPTLIQRTGNEELVSKFFKTYSTLAQATESVITEYGSAAFSDRETIYNAYKKNLRIVRDCGSGAGCWPSGILKNGDNVKYSDGIDLSLAGKSSCGTAPIKFVLTDGSNINIGRCSSNQLNIFIDTNGSKQPNQFGRDQFLLTASSTNGLTDVASISNKGCDISKSDYFNRAFGCTYKILAEGAMNY